MTWRTFLLTAVVAAFGGLLVAYQLHTQTISLATTSASVQARDAYLEDARDEAPELWAATDSVLLRTGLALCDGIRQIPDPQVAPRPVSGLTANELRAITDAATQHLCPAARSRVADYLRGTR